MKQQELEQFIGQLAEAERAAAEKIKQAEAAAERRIEQRRQQLEQQQRQQLDDLAQAFADARKACLEELQDEANRLEASTTARIAVLERHHAQSRETLLRWLIDEVTRP